MIPTRVHYWRVGEMSRLGSRRYLTSKVTTGIKSLWTLMRRGHCPEVRELSRKRWVRVIVVETPRWLCTWQGWLGRCLNKFSVAGVTLAIFDNQPFIVISLTKLLLTRFPRRLSGWLGGFQALVLQSSLTLFIEENNERWRIEIAESSI